MERDEAISIIVQQELINLSKEERESILLDWWGIDSEDPEFLRLPEILQQELGQSDPPSGDKVMDLRYNPLLLEALKNEWIYVKSEYLSQLVSKILCEKVEVKGREENLFACPCCQYKTLSERGGYLICPVCFWEDDGSDLNSQTNYSSVNRMTLAEAKENFKKYGAVTESSLRFIKSDTQKRYYKCE